MTVSERCARQADAEARRIAQTVFDRPVVLEAGAGTGKTAALVARIAAWSLGPGWERATSVDSDLHEEAIAGAVLDGIVAITFTEDAAAEMTSRVAEAFGRLERVGRASAVIGLEPSALPDDCGLVQRRARALLTVIEQLRTMTIHAFARAQVSRWPVEAGVHPAFEVDADGRAVEESVEAVVEALLTEAYGGGRFSGDATLLAGEGIGPREIRRCVLSLVEAGMPSEALDDDPLRPERLRGLVDRLLRNVEIVKPVVEKLGRASGRAKRVAAACDVVLNVEAWAAEDGDFATRLTAIRRRLRALDDAKTSIGRVRDWGRGKGQSNGEEAILPEVPAATLEAFRAIAWDLKWIVTFQPEVFTAVRRIARQALIDVEEVKRRKGILVFQDLLVKCRRLLEQNPSIVNTLRSEIAQLLVDEMQDTDADQGAIVRLLGLGDGPGLFLVGDPKQSIYAWRNADMEVYRRLVREIKDHRGEVHSLTVNFRSVQPVLDEVARLVAPVMVEEEGRQPPFVPLLAGVSEASSDGDGPGAAVEHWFAEAAGEQGGMSSSTSAPEATDLTAESVAREIAALLAAGQRPKDLAILMRSRTHQPAYLEALRRHRIPYTVGKDPNYFRTREVTELMALVRVILDPFDLVALVAVLRSPMVGVPDAALRPLWDEGFPTACLRLEDPEALHGIVERAEARLAALDLGGISLEALAGWPQTLADFLDRLGRLRRSFAGEPPDVFVEQLRMWTAVEPFAAGRFPGAYRLANVDRFLRELETVLLDGGTSDAVLRHLRRVERVRPDEMSGKPRSDAEGVRILTIHGAKGLGFEHVWLVETHAASRGGGGWEPVTAVDRVGEMWEIQLVNHRSPGWFEVEERERRHEEAERVRLLYVALTRAKQRLVTVGKKPESSSFGSFFQERDGGWFATADSWADGAAPAEFDRCGARWVWLGGRNDFETTGDGAVASTREHDPAQIESDADCLEQWTVEALERQARPWFTTASDASHRRLQEAVAARLEGEEEPVEGSDDGADRWVAMTTGTMMHGILEQFDHRVGDLGKELRVRLEDAVAWVTGLPASDRRKNAVTDGLEALVDGFVHGGLWPRYVELGDRILARELDLVMPPEAGGAVGAVTGAIDLVYRDPGTDEIVVADYKTDRVADEAEARERAEVYRPQIDLYALALQRALDLDQLPRRELWFIRPGSILTLDGPDGS